MRVCREGLSLHELILNNVGARTATTPETRVTPTAPLTLGVSIAKMGYKLYIGTASASKNHSSLPREQIRLAHSLDIQTPTTESSVSNK